MQMLIITFFSLFHSYAGHDVKIQLFVFSDLILCRWFVYFSSSFCYTKFEKQQQQSIVHLGTGRIHSSSMVCGSFGAIV